MITIIDYGLGNIQAFVNVYRRLHIPVTIARTVEDLSSATKLILPGVGAFDNAMERLNASGMRSMLDELVLVRKVPVIGICVGMQMLADSSDEGSLPGLGWVPGRVRHFGSVSGLTKLPLPHMGWNDIESLPGHSLFRGLENEARFYFLHSFYFECAQDVNEAARAEYGLNFSCAVSVENIYGVQFHPEKSHHFGVALLKNFAEL